MVDQPGFRPAMKKYGKNHDIKVLIDQMQIESECCGSNSYKDWWNISWWPEQYIDVQNPTVLFLSFLFEL
jgi:hypothetical protein